MRPTLKHFFDSMGSYLARPEQDTLDRLFAEHPGWEAPRSRVALYGDFVRGHVRTSLEKLFPLTRGAAGPEVWDSLVEGYTLTRPARHHELNHLGEGFAAFLADEGSRRGLAPYLPSLARFEWSDFAVFASRSPMPPSVEGLTANPTLVVLELPFRICAYVRAKGQGAPPEPGEELALLWRHPAQLVTYFMAATPHALLALKMAVEGLRAADVAAATGVAEADIADAVSRLARDGLVLAPGS
ncbi:putative DNA-binding domain-containing protein [Myxococcus sp. K15C18031901]|uniref:HvfC/BufC N-terminal domain-containing protein n=1 Tax=Myxococcus dinghuensis TaxID=2906761 RepID=UPI0020A7DB85|nr:putative DNA-binding domain-containing protein [Myxococcus dinghuensis]MCP3104413.1 putative DNA-binding domain-containing protein [Myxococcus dinghuensis]